MTQLPFINRLTYRLVQKAGARHAHVAAERFVMLANPGLSAASKDEIDAWKRQAIEYAIRKRK